MAVTNSQELLKHDLGDLLYAEKQVLKALKPMIRETSDAEMKQRLEQHQGETEQQIQNLERAFEAMGLKARAQKCPGILGIIEEKKEFKEDEEPSAPMLEAFNLGAGLRVEHYEIAAYQAAIALAKSLRQTEVVELLKQNLDQEVAMAKFIVASAPKVLRAVEQMQSAEEAEATNGSARKGGASRRSASKGSTSKRSTSKRSGSRSSGRKSSSSGSSGSRSTSGATA